MTSKSSCFEPSLIWDAVCRKIWFPVLVLIGFFFAFPVALTISLQGAHKMTQYAGNLAVNIADSLQAFFSVVSINSFILMLLGILAALVFFNYLHHRSKLDFYHSHPIALKHLFLIQYLAGALSVLLPYLILYLASLGVVAVFGDFGYLRLSTVVYGLFVPMVSFLTVYSFGVLAAMLTGNMVLQGCTTLYFLMVIPVTVLELMALMGHFFQIYVGNSSFLNEVIYWTSPLFHGFFNEIMPQGGVVDILVGLFAAAVATVLALVLYRRRRSEAAGKSFAFDLFIPLIKYPLIVLGSIGFALLFNVIGGNDSRVDFWLIFGLVAGLLLISRGLEVIIALDVKAAATHWLSLLVCFGAAVLIMGSFALDITNYDNYVPAANEVESVSLDLGSLAVYGDISVIDRYFSEEDLTTMGGEKEKAAVIDIAKAGVAGLPRVNAYSEAEAEDAVSNQTYGKITYYLKNGHVVQRYYPCIVKKDTLPAVETLITSAEYKKKQLHALDNQNVGFASLQYANTGYVVFADMVKEMPYQALVKAYRADAANLTLNEVESTLPVAVLTVKLDDKAEPESYYEYTLPIYAGYENTLALFSAQGYSYEDYGVLTANMIRSAKIITYLDNGETSESPVKESEFKTLLKTSMPFDISSYFIDITEDNYEYSIEVNNTTLTRTPYVFWN